MSRRRKHSKQLVETRKGRFLELVRRSASGLVAVYNLLTPEAIQANTIKAFFNRTCKELLKRRATEGCSDWQETLSPRVPLWKHPLK